MTDNEKFWRDVKRYLFDKLLKSGKILFYENRELM